MSTSAVASKKPTEPEEITDVLVIGSGAAGLAAALAASVAGAQVEVVERADTMGGTTAVSGGVAWIPAHGRGGEGAYSTDDAMAYLLSLSNGTVDEPLAKVFVESGASVLDFIEAHTALRWSAVEGFPDYKPERPGSRPEGGRAFVPAAIAAVTIGDWATQITAYPVDGIGGGLDNESKARMYGGSNGLVGGQALVGSMLGTLSARGVKFRNRSRAVRLLKDGSGSVNGAEIETDGGLAVIHARRGVVLANGGFEWDPELVRTFLRGPMHRPGSVPTNTGDGLRMAMDEGAALGNMKEAWWTPAIKIPGDVFLGQPRVRSVRVERTYPRTIMVNRAGKRFVNEAVDYNSIAGAFHYFDPQSFAYVNSPAWIVFDHEYLRRYAFVGFKAGDEVPSWFHRSPDLKLLAKATGIDPEGLEATVRVWNENVAQLKDPAFGRGTSHYDGWWGDQAATSLAAKTLGPLDQGPYYAVEIDVATLGTKGGPKTDVNAQVIHRSGRMIEGFYAAGNVMANPMGMLYPGAGGTIGPALVWGVRAGHHAATGQSFRG